MESNMFDKSQKRSRMKGILVLMSSLLVFSACDTASDKAPIHQTSTPNPQNLNHNIGWIHGPCLAIRNSNLKPGTTIRMVVLSTPQTIIDTTVLGTADPKSGCPALLNDRADINKQDGRYFYTLDTGRASPNAMAIGLMPAVAKTKSANPMVDLDLNQDGTTEHANTCLTSEGVQFYISSSATFDEKALWSDYYYLGYDNKPTCP